MPSASLARPAVPASLLLAGVLLCLCGPPAAAQGAGRGDATQPRNDTGQTTCYDADGQQTPCAAPGFPGHDARFGRDAAAADGVLPKTGDGTGGFDFTKIANDGSELPPDAPLGPGPGDWACTRDNLTGQLWEIKLDEPASPRHYQWSYTWFDPDGEYNGGNPGADSPPAPSCGFTLDCDTQAYVAFVNSVALCGRDDWRMPTLEELSGIVNYGSSFPDGGAMDRIFFADGGGYSGWGSTWTADSAHEPPEGEAAWLINFDDGHAEQIPKGSLVGVRLVSGPLPDPTGEAPRCGKRQNPFIRPSTAGAFTLNADGTASDARTGLTWARCPLGQELVGEGPDATCEGEPLTLTWQEAMQLVQERNAEVYLGYDDWRLPNVKELQSITERQCFGPVVDLSVFPEMGIPYWTSTSSDWHPEQAWAIEFFGGNYHPVMKGEVWPGVRLVRGGAPFDDYESPLAYSVGGTVTGLVGTDLVLRLESSAGGETLSVDADGAFVFGLGLSDGDEYHVSVEQPPVPYQSCTVENGDGTVAGGDVTDVVVACAPPDPARIEVTPDALALSLFEGETARDTLRIGNVGGGILEWSVGTAYPPSARRGRGARGIDCEGAPGIIIHDDGTSETGYAGNTFWSGGFMIVDRFTPTTYPASIESVCLAFARNGGATAVDFEIVVLDDNGPGGSPGGVIGVLAASATDIPPFSPPSAQWYSYDLSSLYTTVTSGSLYVGVRFAGGAPNAFLLGDQSPGNPPGYAGGYYWNWGDAGLWTPMIERDPAYRALFVRAVEAGPQEPPAGCEDPTAIPWLSVTPAAGSTLAGEHSDVVVAANGLGMDPGRYDALLCVSSSDGDAPLVEVPVSLTVASSTAPSLALTPASPPVVVPRGERFGFSATLSVPPDGPSSLDYWAEATLPNGTVRRVFGPGTIAVTPGTIVTRALSQRVPRAAPLGDYTYTMKVGGYPDTVLASDGFDVTVAGAGVAAREAGAGDDAWRLYLEGGTLLDAGSVLDLRVTEAAVTEEAAAAAAELPSAPALHAPYPNPFGAAATVRYDVPASGRVRVVVYDLLGRELAVLADGTHEPGRYAAVLDGRSLPAGVYLVRMDAPGFSQTVRVTALR